MASNELQMIIDTFRSGPKISDLSIEEQRAKVEVDLTQFQVPTDVRCDPVDAGGVPAEWITTPGMVAERVIYYLHGGGYGLPQKTRSQRQWTTPQQPTAGSFLLG